MAIRKTGFETTTVSVVVEKRSGGRLVERKTIKVESKFRPQRGAQRGAIEDTATLLRSVFGPAPSSEEHIEHKKK